MDVLDLNLAQQLDLLSRKENHFLDFKSAAIEVSKLQRTIVAFANADGGEVFVGIGNDLNQRPEDRIDGFPDFEAANLYTRIPEGLVKPALLGCEFAFLRLPARPDRYVLQIIIPKSDRAHFTSGDQCYKRQNAENLPIAGPELERLLFTKGQKSYEDTPVDAVTVSDLLRSKYLKTYLRRVPSVQPAEQFLVKQKLVVEQKSGKLGSKHIRVAGVLLFDDLPQASLASKCGVKITRVKTAGSAYSRRFLDKKPITVEGPVEELINVTVEHIKEMMDRSRLKIRGGAYRRYRYPPEAIHEIITNTIIHRDYHISDDVHVFLYDNRIEVLSPGKLPGHVTVQNILQQRFLRNNQIVRLLNKLPDAPNQDIGEGLDTAFRTMQEARLKPPVIEELENAVRVTLLHEDIASREQQIIDFLRDNRTITNKQARKATGVESEQAIFKVFKRLLQADIIELVDPKVPAFERSYRLRRGWEKRFTPE